MSTPVDLTNLREITEGDAAMEQELFKEFIASADSYIINLGNMMSAEQHESWRTTAHAFKGLAINLGATHLSELCKKAQENNTANTQEKTAMLKDINQEYTAVKSFLDDMLVS